MTYLVLPYHKNPYLKNNEMYNFGSRLRGNAYMYTLGLSDICSAVEN